MVLCQHMFQLKKSFVCKKSDCMHQGRDVVLGTCTHTWGVQYSYWRVWYLYVCSYSLPLTMVLVFCMLLANMLKYLHYFVLLPHETTQHWLSCHLARIVSFFTHWILHLLLYCKTKSLIWVAKTWFQTEFRLDFGLRRKSATKLMHVYTSS